MNLSDNSTVDIGEKVTVFTYFYVPDPTKNFCFEGKQESNVCIPRNLFL